MIAEVNQIMGRDDCHAAVAVQHRPAWALKALFAILLPLVILLSQRPLDLIAVVVIAGVMAGYFIFTTTNYWLARCDDAIVLVKLSQWSSNPAEVVDQYSYPLAVEVTSGRAAHLVTWNGDRFLLANVAFEDFQEVTGHSEPPHGDLPPPTIGA